MLKSYWLSTALISYLIGQAGQIGQFWCRIMQITSFEDFVTEPSINLISATTFPSEPSIILTR